ncbi:MAG TPA: alpha/beta hydrolase [Chitinophagaceae bacterium]|nr:alpha/beta hydrolase [Chitinophagaceae bacterium]
MKLVYSILLASTMAIACNKSGKDDAPVSTEEFVTKDVSYGNDPAQKMDIYLPAGRSSSKTKVMVLIHGGGWTGGDKSEFDPFIPQIRQKLPDYALFNINYRLANNTTNRFPMQENDVKAAIEFISGKLGDYNVSEDMVLLGFSAGAHLALLQGYKYSSPMRTKAVVSFYGPTDLVDMYNNPVSQYAPLLLQALLGSTPQQNVAVYNQSSPVFFVNSSSPPTIILHGGQDNLVSHTQATILQNKLQQAGVVNQYVFYPNEGHGWFGATLDDSFVKIQAFLATNVK